MTTIDRSVELDAVIHDIELHRKVLFTELGVIQFEDGVDTTDEYASLERSAATSRRREL